MSHNLTRRRFLEAALAAPAVIGVAGETPQIKALEQPVPSALTSRRESLRAAMDEIIPASDGMPAASAAGGLEYLSRVSRREPEFGADIEQALDSIDQLTATQFHGTFAALSSPQRIEVLTALEKQSPELFARLRDHVYESYYTQPEVWKLIGYEFHPTDQSGPHMKPFDESVLAKVRQMPRMYREVS